MKSLQMKWPAIKVRSRKALPELSLERSSDKTKAAQLKSVRHWATMGALSGIFFAVIWFAPARWLASGLANASQEVLTLHEPRGTVWQGSAALVLAGGEGSRGAQSLPSRLHWRIQPRWLGVDLELLATCCTPTNQPVLIALRLTNHSWLHFFDAKPQQRVDAASRTGVPTLMWRLSASELTLPTQWLVGLGSPWNTLQLAGSLRLNCENLQGDWSESAGISDVRGRAKLSIYRLASALSALKPLGDYTVIVQDQVLQLTTLENSERPAALVLSGLGQWRQGAAKAQISFSGEAMAAKGYEEALSHLLHTIGQRQMSEDGRMRSILNF